MTNNISLKDISIRTKLLPEDFNNIIYLHGYYSNLEYNYGTSFQSYLVDSLNEFYRNYDPEKDRVWICEHNNKVIGSLFLMHRDGNSAQLRYFLILPDYRGIGLGKKLLSSYMDSLKSLGYHSSYLWTTDELKTAAALYKKFGFLLTEEKESTAFGKPLIEQRYDLIVK